MCLLLHDRHRCGYVGIGPNHCLYKKGYDDNIPEQLIKKWEEIKNGPVGKRGIMDIFCYSMFPDNIPTVSLLFDVHGGITYSGDGGGVYPANSQDIWWFGFDCGHDGDGSLSKYSFMYDTYPVRSQEYVEAECERLAAQLKDIGELK